MTVSWTTVVVVAAMVAHTVVAVGEVVVVYNRDWWQWCLMAVAALDGGHATTSRRSKRAA